MDLKTLLRKLSPVVEPEGTVVTLTLDLSKSGILPPATRIFLKDQVERCRFCGEGVVPISITQAVIAHALANLPMALTFVPPRTGWLRDLDGMAATLSARGARRKTAAAGR